MKKDPIIEEGIVAGNVYPKYSTGNPIARALMNNFLRSVDEAVAEVDPLDIHEVGCGEGYLISRYAKEGRTLIASDFSEQVIELANKLAHSTKEDITFKVKSIYAVSADDDAANLIICSEVFEHLEKPELALKALKKIARPYLIASVPREPVWRILNTMRGKYVRDFGNTPGHIQHWSQKDFVEFIGKHFNVLNVLSPFPWTLVLAKVKDD